MALYECEKVGGGVRQNITITPISNRVTINNYNCFKQDGICYFNGKFTANENIAAGDDFAQGFPIALNNPIDTVTVITMSQTGRGFALPYKTGYNSMVIAPTGGSVSSGSTFMLNFSYPCE